MKDGKIRKEFLIMLAFICLYRQSLTECNTGLGLGDLDAGVRSATNQLCGLGQVISLWPLVFFLVK